MSHRKSSRILDINVKYLPDFTIIFLRIQGVQNLSWIAIAKDQNIGVTSMWQILDQRCCRSIAERFKLFAKRNGDGKQRRHDASLETRAEVDHRTGEFHPLIKYSFRSVVFVIPKVCTRVGGISK